MGRTRRLLLLIYLLVSSCARQLQCTESAEQFCEGLNNCYTTSMGVYRGESQSLYLSLNSNGHKFVKKCDPKTKKLKEEFQEVHGNINSLTEKNTSISLVNGNFTVQNAKKTEEGLYKIEEYLHNSCLAVVNVTVLDPPLSKAFTPSKVTEAPEASPPGTNYTAIYVAVPASVCTIILIILIIFIIRKLRKKKSKDRPREATSDVDPEQLMNGLLPQQEESSIV